MASKASEDISGRVSRLSHRISGKQADHVSQAGAKSDRMNELSEPTGDSFDMHEDIRSMMEKLKRVSGMVEQMTGIPYVDLETAQEAVLGPPLRSESTGAILDVFPKAFHSEASQRRPVYVTERKVSSQLFTGEWKGADLYDGPSSVSGPLITFTDGTSCEGYFVGETFRFETARGECIGRLADNGSLQWSNGTIWFRPGEGSEEGTMYTADIEQMQGGDGSQDQPCTQQSNVIAMPPRLT